MAFWRGRAGTSTGRRSRWGKSILVGASALTVAVLALPTTAQAGLLGGSTTTYIVSEPAGSIAGAFNAITSVGASVGVNLGFVNAATAQLTPLQVTLLQLVPGVVLTPDVNVALQGTFASTRAPAAVYPEQTGASSLWSQGDTGAGVNVAVLDTGIDAALPDLAGRVVGGVDLSGGGNPFVDSYGHGTFVSGLIASDGASSDGQYMGEAPGAGLVAVKVAGASGQTDLATIIEGVGWTIANAATDNIRVLNMSLGYVPLESTAIDPLDQAVEKAWDAGIVVVASAGNDGPDNGTIFSPGDDPLVITAGAVDDQGQTNPADDVMTTFSAVGPTSPDGWFKPDLVAPGRSVVSLRDPGSTIDTDYSSARVGSANFVGSGTSFSAAITSGAAALVLADHPTDTPSMVKAALLGTTTPGPVGDPFVDGHGILDVAAAAAAAPMNVFESPVTLPTLNGTTVSLENTWVLSSWDPALWAGLSVSVPVVTSPLGTGLSWTGATWNSSAWNSSAWNSSAWNSSAWNSSAWNSSAWNSSAWNSSAWNSSAWNSSAWN
jgi:serine protease AprX